MLPIEAFLADFKAVGLGGLSVAGSDTAAVNGPYVYAGAVAGHPSYVHYNGGYTLRWDAVTAEWWLVADDDPTTALYQHDASSPAGEWDEAADFGAVVVTLDPVSWGELLTVDQHGHLLPPPGGGKPIPQTVLTQYGVTDRPNKPRDFARFCVQIACYHTNRKVAEVRAQAAWDHYKRYTGATSSAPGLPLTGWTAQQVQADVPGVIDALQVAGGLLYKGVTNITLINLTGG